MNSVRREVEISRGRVRGHVAVVVLSLRGRGQAIGEPGSYGVGKLLDRLGIEGEGKGRG